MAATRKIEVFSAGCAVCDDTVALINRIACPSCEAGSCKKSRPIRSSERSRRGHRRQARRLLRRAWSGWATIACGRYRCAVTNV